MEFRGIATACTVATREAPSMIAYGVPTSEAILMRSLGVPRSVGASLGNRFKRVEQGGAPTPMSRLQQARAWLASSPDDLWQDIARESNRPLDGNRMGQVWQTIMGTSTKVGDA